MTCRRGPHHTLLLSSSSPAVRHTWVKRDCSLLRAVTPALLRAGGEKESLPNCLPKRKQNPTKTACLEKARPQFPRLPGGTQKTTGAGMAENTGRQTTLCAQPESPRMSATVSALMWGESKSIEKLKGAFVSSFPMSPYSTPALPPPRFLGPPHSN